VIGNYADWFPYPAEVCGKLDAHDAYTAKVAETV
jgi:hypothetical protein